MSSFDAALLAEQLAQLGRDLQAEVAELGCLEEMCVDAEAAYRRYLDLHEDDQARAFLRAQGTNADARKAEARLATVEGRIMADKYWREWTALKARVRTQQASLQALHRRCEIGRSLLSREKALISLGELYGSVPAPADVRPVHDGRAPEQLRECGGMQLPVPHPFLILLQP